MAALPAVRAQTPPVPAASTAECQFNPQPGAWRTFEVTTRVNILKPPARDVYGLRLVPSAFNYKELSGNPASLKGAQHCRSEVFLLR